mgnify:CR=1 FL=1
MLKNCILNFAKLLAGHDWTYHMSDDQRAYEAGRRKEFEIRKFVDNHDLIRGILEAMYSTANPYTNGEIQT